MEHRPAGTIYSVQRQNQNEEGDSMGNEKRLQQRCLTVTIMRGGTSKGVYILETDLPEEKGEWEGILLRMIGSPDQKQINRLGD